MTRPTCGSRAGYLAHIREKEATCAPCRAAHAAYRRARRKAGVERHKAECINCGGSTYGLRCKPCADALANPKPRPETREIAWRGGWVRDGLIWRPVASLTEANGAGARAGRVTLGRVS